MFSIMALMKAHPWASLILIVLMLFLAFKLVG
jgi:hypothetical protein